jgi:hypothetical protein
MKKDLIFFGKDGLTQTSANHIANLCKEAYLQLEKELAGIGFYSSTVRLIGSGQESLLKQGTKDISWIPTHLDKVAKYKSLIAWLREAIKASENLFKEVEEMDYSDFGIEEPERPVKEDAITENDVIATWNIKQRNRYYYLDTLCAQIGQYIHPNGTFSEARNRMYDVINEPHKVSGSGRDTVIYSYEPTMDSSEVDSMFMELQNQYRSYQAELNSMKHSIETAIQDDRNKKNSEYAKAFQEYSIKAKDAQNILECKRLELQKEIQDMKIIIPDSLKPVYEEVSALGKK